MPARPDPSTPTGPSTSPGPSSRPGPATPLTPATLLGAAGPRGPAGAGVAACLRRMSHDGELDLPLPGHGDTGARWAALAGWGRRDLALARLAEGHTDAVAILAEAGREPEPGALYGVWAARSGGTGAELAGRPGAWRLHGTIRFCSGAHDLDRALVVGSGRVVDVALSDPGVHPVAGTWTPTGMEASDSVDVELDDVAVPDHALVGDHGFYLGRPGFWWGGAGVAAVWLGGAAGVVDDVTALLRGSGPGGSRSGPDAHQLAHLGAMHTAVAAVDALLVRTAAGIDADPRSAHREAVRTVRAAAEQACRRLLDAAPRTAGVAALTRGGPLAARLADLGVYVRQHHGERDLAELGSAVLDGSAVPDTAVLDAVGPDTAGPGTGRDMTVPDRAATSDGDR